MTDKTILARARKVLKELPGATLEEGVHAWEIRCQSADIDVVEVCKNAGLDVYDADVGIYRIDGLCLTLDQWRIKNVICSVADELGVSMAISKSFLERLFGSLDGALVALESGPKAPTHKSTLGTGCHKLLDAESWRPLEARQEYYLKVIDLVLTEHSGYHPWRYERWFYDQPADSVLFIPGVGDATKLTVQKHDGQWHLYAITSAGDRVWVSPKLAKMIWKWTPKKVEAAGHEQTNGLGGTPSNGAAQ